MTHAICKIQTIGQPEPQVESVRINIGRKKKSDPPAFRYVPNTAALDRLFCNGKDTVKAGYEIVFYQLFDNEKDENPYLRMSHSYWEARYKPVMDGCEKCANPKSISYEEAAEIAQDPKRRDFLWTEAQGEGTFFIANGYHYVNRMDYYLTEIPCEPEMDGVEVYDEPEPSMVDDVNDGYSTLIHKSNGLLVKRLDGEVDNFKKYIRRLARTRYSVTLDRNLTDLDELVDEFHSQTEAMGVEIELY